MYPYADPVKDPTNNLNQNGWEGSRCLDAETIKTSVSMSTVKRQFCKVKSLDKMLSVDVNINARGISIDYTWTL
jgi:hypothetical protein